MHSSRSKSKGSKTTSLQAHLLNNNSNLREAKRRKPRVKLERTLRIVRREDSVKKAKKTAVGEEGQEERGKRRRLRRSKRLCELMIMLSFCIVNYLNIAVTLILHREIDGI